MKVTMMKKMNSRSYLRILSVVAKIVSPIILQKVINDFAVCKDYSGTLLLVEDKHQNYIFQKGITVLVDQPRTCVVFMSCSIESIFLTQYDNQFSLYKICLESFIFVKQK